MKAARHQRGLTLVEMIVVLMIAAMALALGFQSLGQWRQADAAIVGIIGEARRARLVEHWLRESVRALVPLEEQPFAGERHRWAGVSLSPVFAGQGGSTPMEWEFRQNGPEVVLGLIEFEQTRDLPLPGVVSADFAYIDSQGGVHQQWPPASGVGDHLPAAVVARLTHGSGRTVIWAAPIHGARNPIYSPYEMETD